MRKKAPVKAPVNIPIVLTCEQGRTVIHGEHVDFERVFHTEKALRIGRWGIHWEAVFTHIPTGKHYAMEWIDPCIEDEEHVVEYFETEDPVLTEVKLTPITHYEWAPVIHT